MTSFLTSGPDLFELSREALTGASEHDLDTEASRHAVRLVAGAACRGAVVIADPGHLRRVDFWVHPSGLVVQGFADDPAVSIAGSVHHGRASAVSAFAQLLSFPEPAEGGLSHPDELVHSDLDSLLSEVVSAPASSAAVNVRVLIVERSENDRLVVPSMCRGGQVRWARESPDGVVRFEQDGLAQLWSIYVGVLESVAAEADD